jgi:hypothetical protein
MDSALYAITEKLQGALTVAELIERLQDMEPAARVVFGCCYGDYSRTEQALMVASVEESNSTEIHETAYSESGLCIAEGDETDDDSDAYMPVVILR